ncbi:MAG: hypothetical protein ACOVNR_11275, partial [Chitinophagaceae bacterium]
MKKLSTLILFSLLLFAGFVNAQVSLNKTDSLANHQKLYIIRYNVKNGNVYLPIAKKLKDAPQGQLEYKTDESKNYSDASKYLVSGRFLKPKV